MQRATAADLLRPSFPRDPSGARRRPGPARMSRACLLAGGLLAPFALGVGPLAAGLLGAGLLGTAPAWGQASTPAPTPAQPPAAGGSAAPPERIGPPITGGQGSGQGPAAPGGSLSQQLQQGQGVIQPPPGIDPQMGKKPPAAGAPAVIPPPGTPQNQPDVRPQ